MAREPVYLNVYSKKWMSDYLWSLGVGVYHSGVEVYGTEYCFGWHWRPISGIFEIEPKCEDEVGEDYKFKESILLGHTDFTRSDVLSIVNQMGDDFLGQKYHLMNKNCNHFTDALSKMLCGKEIPSWINRLAYLTSCIPFIEKAVPRTWLIPMPPQSYRENQVSADDTETDRICRTQPTRPMTNSSAVGPMSARSTSTQNSPRQFFNNVMGFFGR